MFTPADSGNPSADNEPRWKLYACFALLLVCLHLTVGPRVRLSQWQVFAESNAALEEALRWKEGSLALRLNDYEVARVGENRYNVVGLAFVFISLVGTSLTALTGGPPGTFYPPYYVALVALPLILAAYGAFRGQMRSSVWAAVLTGYLIAGTSLVPVLQRCGGAQGGSVYDINHVLAVVGLLLFASDLLGPRRLWPAMIGLALAAWSRQMTALYALPLLGLTFMGGPAGPSPRRRRWIVLVGLAVTAAVPLALNTLKFGNPFDTGYGRLYEGRRDPIGRSGHEKLFGLRYVPEHLRAMNSAFPSWDIRAGTLYPDTSDVNGGSIWLTCPLLIAVFLTLPQWWRDRPRRWLMLATLPVIAGLACYHTTGAMGAGCYRYSLDFIPIWFMVIAPYVTTGRFAGWTIGCLAYSALYFNLLP